MDNEESAHHAYLLIQRLIAHVKGQKKLSPDVDVIQHVELLASYLHKRLIQRNSRVVDQAVDSAQEIDGLTGQRDDLIHVIEIRFEAVDRRPIDRISSTAESAPVALCA